MQLYVKVIPLSAGTSQPAGDALMLSCPPDVEPDTMLSFLTQKFGEPIEVACTSTSRHPRLATGWIFAGRQATATDPEVEYLCVPHIRTSDWTLHNMLELQADQRLEFEQLVDSGDIDSYTVITAPHQTYQPPSTDAGTEQRNRDPVVSRQSDQTVNRGC